MEGEAHMIRAFFTSVLFLTCIFLFQFSASSDTIKLKSGQVHEGEITAEDGDRVQLKLEGSNVRLWFPREQIESVERTTPRKKTDERKRDAGKGSDAHLDDDVTRARELLEKMRQEEKRGSDKLPSRSPGYDQAATPTESATTTSVNASEIDELIQQLREGDIYKQLEACRKAKALGATEVIPDLIHLLDDEKFLLRREANDSLMAITGEDFAYNPKAARSVRMEAIKRWKVWYEKEMKVGTDSFFKSLW